MILIVSGFLSKTFFVPDFHQGIEENRDSPAPPEITALVEKFDRRLNEYRSSCYNEDELRTEFVNLRGLRSL